MTECHTEIKMKLEVGIRSLIPLAKTHFRCACLCASKCKEIEKEFIDGSIIRDKNDMQQEDMSYAAGAVMSSVAFLESSINEIFRDIFDKFNKLKTNDSIWMNLKYDCEENFLRRKSLEEKYELAYKIINKKLDKNDIIYINFKKLIILRNLLVHFKAKWQPDDPEDDQYEIAYFKDKFKENPFMEDTGNPYFPQKCLGAGCAEWAIAVSTDFLTAFSDELSKSGMDIQLRTNVNKILQQYSIKTN